MCSFIRLALTVRRQILHGIFGPLMFELVMLR
jgi:hypothetical protein